MYGETSHSNYQTPHADTQHNVSKQTNNTFYSHIFRRQLSSGASSSSQEEQLLGSSFGKNQILHCAFFNNPLLGRPAGGTLNLLAEIMVNKKHNKKLLN